MGIFKLRVYLSEERRALILLTYINVTPIIERFNIMHAITVIVIMTAGNLQRRTALFQINFSEIK